jgi:hypothetical protein
MAEEARKLAYSKRTWIREFLAKRPTHEIETRQRELAFLEQAQHDYAAAAERDRKAEIMDG